MPINETTAESQKPSPKRILRKTGEHFLAGLIVVAPIGITVLVLIWIFNTVDNILEPIVSAIFGRPIPGVGFATTILLIYVMGVIAENFVGKQLIHYGESLLLKIPIVRGLYGSIREITRSLRDSGKTNFLQMVLVDFPKTGMKTIGFITNEALDRNGRKLISVFIPTPPNPAAGFLELVREEDIIRTNVPINDAIKLVVSIGKVMPQELIDKLSSGSPPPEK